MMNSLRIREYRSSDKTELLTILKLNVPEYFAESEIDDFDEYLDHKIEKYFVIVLENKIVGAGGINFDDDRKIGKISWDFVNPYFQGKGIGKALLKHRIDLLHATTAVENITVRTSQLAYRFYEKNGFVLNHIVKDYWADGFDLYEMTYQ